MADLNFSVFTRAPATSTDPSELTEVLDRALGAIAEKARWDISRGDFWCCVTPREQVGLSQGWKLHLSATMSSATQVLAQALPVLLEGGCSFTFASTREHVAHLNARNTSRGHSGKFITVYPQSDDDAVRLAEALHEATVGLPGPRILSDRPYAPGSLVHYRYGAFVEKRRLTNDSEHLSLAEELVPGVSLRQWVLDRIRHGGWRRHISGTVTMAERLVELMTVAHSAGLILRDFNPSNIMVLPDRQLRLINLELAVLPGEQQERLTGAGTPGYGAPEQMRGAPAAIEADYYSLGATLCFVVTGATPDLLTDVPQGRPLRECLAEWLAARRAADPPAAIRELILHLMDDEPERRWSALEARDALAAARRHPARPEHARCSPGPRSGDDDARVVDELWGHVVEGSVGYLLDSMSPTGADRLWPASCAHGAADPCAVQLGAAGVLGVLTRCLTLTGDQRLPEVIATAGNWITQRLTSDGTRPPGLYFGTAGIAWTLYEAGRALGDDRLADRGLALAATLAPSSGNPDLTHGTAGIGLTFLHLWLRTRDEALARRAARSADALVTSAAEEPSGISWGTPAALESRMASGRYHGFAHGTAGVGYVLLAMGLATGRSDCLELAYRAGETLLANALVADGVAQWSAGPDGDATAPYWCHGSAGIGAFLIRLHRATGDGRFRKLAEMSAHAVMENSWRGVLGQCHGLAGNGELILDMAQMADRHRYETMAQQLARVILASRAHHHGQVVFPDEHGSPSPVWADGVSGILAFLLRLRHRSSRLWMVDSVFESPFPGDRGRSA